jgi:hypothetical protein
MVDRQRHVAHRPRYNLLLPVVLYAHNPAFHFSNTEYRDLRLIDNDRSSEKASTHSMI